MAASAPPGRYQTKSPLWAPLPTSISGPFRHATPTHPPVLVATNLARPDPPTSRFVSSRTINASGTPLQQCDCWTPGRYALTTRQRSSKLDCLPTPPGSLGPNRLISASHFNHPVGLISEAVNPFGPEPITPFAHCAAVSPDSSRNRVDRPASLETFDHRLPLRNVVLAFS